MQQKILDIQALLVEASGMGVAGCKETIEFLDDLNTWGTDLEYENSMLREEVERLNRIVKGEHDYEG